MFTTAGIARFTMGAKVVSGTCLGAARGVRKNWNAIGAADGDDERTRQQGNDGEQGPPWIC